MSGSFVAMAAWGLVVLAAFVGWGGAIGAWLFSGRPADVGLRAAWGLAFALFVGGWSCLFSVGSKGMVFTFVVLGVALACAHWLRHRRRPSEVFAALEARWKEAPGTTVVLLFCVVAALLQYAGSICNIRFNANDDFVAYFPFAKQILQQGTLFDPFSTRRVMSFGGQSFLHAIVLAGSPGFRLHVLDQGICLLATALLVFGERRQGRPLWPILLALVVLLTLPDVRANTYSQMSGVVVFYGLYRTLAWLDEGETRPFANAAVISLMAAAACTLRSNYIAVAVPMVALVYANLVRKDRGARRRRLLEACYAAAFGLLFLVPWMLLSYFSSGTPLFPLIQGHFNDAFPMLQNIGNWRDQMAMFADTVTRNRVLATFPLFVLAGVLLPDRGPRKPLHTLLLSGFIGWVLLVHTLDSDVPSFERYVYAFLIAFALAVLTRCTIDLDTMSPSRRVAIRCGQTAAVIAVCGQLFLVGGNALVHHAELVQQVARLATNTVPAPELTPAGQRHQALQKHVPPGATLLVMVDFPFLFDFARNDIYNIDTAAAVSPPPGWPYFKGPESVADYLRGQSIRYLAFVRPEHAIMLFRKDVWERQLTGPHPIWRAHAPLYLDLFENLARLDATRKHLYDDGALVLLDLSSPREIRTATPGITKPGS